MAKIASNSAFDAIELPVSRVLAIQTTRLHPFKENKANSIFGQFNLGMHVGDDPLSVLENRRQLAKFLPINTQIQWLDQVHENGVVVVNHVSSKPLTADAAVTRTKLLGLAVMTADCLPILLANKSGSEIAVIHGGWKPLAKNTIHKTLESMHSPVEDLLAWLGPCIGPAHFEVGQEVVETFCEIDSDLQGAFISTGEKNESKYFGNLQEIASILLTKSGVQTIASLPNCTFAMNHRYYSYRKEKTTGRMALVACLI